MKHLKNLLLVIAGTAMSAILVGVAFLLLSAFLPNLMGELGCGVLQPPNPAKGRELFFVIGLACGAVFGVAFMVFSLATGGIKGLMKGRKPQHNQDPNV